MYSSNHNATGMSHKSHTKKDFTRISLNPTFINCFVRYYIVYKQEQQLPGATAQDSNLCASAIRNIQVHSCMYASWNEIWY